MGFNFLRRPVPVFSMLLVLGLAWGCYWDGAAASLVVAGEVLSNPAKPGVSKRVSVADSRRGEGDDVAGIAEKPPCDAAALAMALPPRTRLSNDEGEDRDPVIDGGQVAWIKDGGAGSAEIWFYDGAVAQQIATVPVGPDEVYLYIDNGWVFWEAMDDDFDDYEKWVYNAQEDELLQISDDATVDKLHSTFENGKVIWQTGPEYEYLDLLFFDGSNTMTLAVSGNYSGFYLRDGWVAWGEGTGLPYGHEYQIMLSDGSEFINVSQIGVANGFGGHRLRRGGWFGLGGEGAPVQGQRVAWMGWDGEADSPFGDWEILFYDGVGVERLTDHMSSDENPQVWGDQVAWGNTLSPWALWLYDGQDNVLLTDNFVGEGESFTFEDGKVVWWDSNDLRCYDTGSQVLTVLEDFAYSPSGPSFWDPIVDDKGVFWVYREWIPHPIDRVDWTLKLFDGSQTTEVDTVQNDFYGARYQGGCVAWSEKQDDTIQCKEWISWPSPGHWDYTTRTVRDVETFLYCRNDGVEQVTMEGYRSCSQVGDLDSGQVVWSGECEDWPLCNSCTHNARDIFFAGKPVGELRVDDMSLGPVLEDGETVQVTAAVYNDGPTPLSDVAVDFLVDSQIEDQDTIPAIDPGSSFNMSFQWLVDWTMAEQHYGGSSLVVDVDPDGDINESDEANNRATKSIPALEKGSKQNDVDGRGFVISTPSVLPYAVPVAVWFDDDAWETEDGLPTRHYNPIATSQAVLDDLEMDFAHVEFGGFGSPGQVDQLYLTDFSTFQAKDTIEEYWESSPGIVLVEYSNRTQIVAAPIASYLNWPMLSSGMLGDAASRQALEDLIDDLGVTYVLVLAVDGVSGGNIVGDLAGLDLLPGKVLMVKAVTVDPLGDDAPLEALKDAMEAFGEWPSGIVVANSRDDACLAAAPLAAFYKAAVLDVREVVSSAVSYAANNYSALQSINDLVSDIADKGGTDHDIWGFVIEHGIYDREGWTSTYLVGMEEWLPFGIKQEPTNPSMDPGDDDKDWIASDYDYYNAGYRQVPGGRFPLPVSDSIDHVAMALQFDQLPLGGRDRDDGWEDNVLGAGIYNKYGMRRWPQQWVWWLDSVVYQLRDLSSGKTGVEVTRLFEDVSAHGGGWGQNWYRFDNRWGEWDEDYRLIEKAPLFWDTRDPQANPSAPGNRGDGVNNDDDRVGWENNDGKFPIERIADVDASGNYTPGDIILNSGNTPGIQATAFVEVAWLTTDEEVWDGFDNDGDGTIDEDCSYYRLMEVEEVYNEALAGGDPDVDPGEFIDLVDENLMAEMGDEGLILYSGHAWTDVWDMSNMGGTWDPDGFGPIPPKTSDNRTYDDRTLLSAEVPTMAPALVIACACGSARVWEADCIAQEFLRKGALAYVGATSIAWGSSDEFRQQMFNQLSDGRLHIGRAFKFAVDNLDQNDLWAKRFGEGNDFANMTRYEMNLFGLASTEIDPGDGVEQRVSYGSPVYDSVSKTWSVDATFDIPAPVELTDAEENVTDIVMPCDLLPYFSDGGDYPALSLIPFEYQLPVGGSLVGVAQTEAVVYDSYGFSLPKLADYPMWPPDGEEYADAPQAPDEEPELYDGALFPDVLFVSDSEHDAVSNSDRVFGSVSAYQVDGTVPETTVYDSVVLRLAYTTPLGLEETHVVSGANITVEATIFSADGDPHTVRPVVRVETLGGLLYEEQTGADLSVNATPRVVDFHVSDIVPRTYVVRITVTEADVPVAELSFQESQPGASVSGVIGEANCEALEGATVKLLRDSTEVASVASGAGGTYELTAPEVGTYSLVASAAGFKEEAQAIEVSDIETDYGVDFQGNTGLVPAAATMSYVLECVNHWLFPPDEDCGLSMSTVLAVVNAWLYPT